MHKLCCIDRTDEWHAWVKQSPEFEDVFAPKEDMKEARKRAAHAPLGAFQDDGFLVPHYERINLRLAEATDNMFPYDNDSFVCRSKTARS